MASGRSQSGRRRRRQAAYPTRVYSGQFHGAVEFRLRQLLLPVVGNTSDQSFLRLGHLAHDQGLYSVQRRLSLCRAALMHEWRLFRLFREPGAAAEYLCNRHSFRRFEPGLMGMHRDAFFRRMVQPPSTPLHFGSSGLSDHTTLAAAHPLKPRWYKWPRRRSGRVDRSFRWPTVGLTIDPQGRTFTGVYILRGRLPAVFITG